MTIRTLFLGTATAGLLLTASAVFNNPLNPIAAAKADVDVDISIGTFYDRLAPYGGWTSYGGAEVFIPNDIVVSWRPYTRGHWEYTRRYGWLWVSDEPYGWATYHYGRWGYGNDVGWYWVPGRRWAPAWVDWRRDDDNVVWAPMPPRGDDIDVSFNLSVGEPPDYGWVVVPARNFLALNISTVVVRDVYERRRIWQRARPYGNVRVVNNVVVNNNIEVNYIERRANRKVRVVEVEETRDPNRAGRKRGNAVEVFNPEIKPDRGAKPKKVVNIDEVKERQTKRRQRLEAEEAAAAPGAADVPATTKAERQKARAVEQDKAKQATDQQLKQRKAERRQKANQVEQDQAQELTPAQKRKQQRREAAKKQQDQEQVQTTKQKRRAKQQADQAKQVDNQQQQRRKRRAQQAEQAQQGDQVRTQRQKRRQQQIQAGENQPQQKKQQRRKRGCDPAVNPNCPG